MWRLREPQFAAKINREEHTCGAECARVHRTRSNCGEILPRRKHDDGKGCLQHRMALAHSAKHHRRVIFQKKGRNVTFAPEIQKSVPVATASTIYRVIAHTYTPAALENTKVDVDDCQQETVQLKWSSGNTLRMETSDSKRKVELEAKIQYLNQTLHEKWEEYQALVMKEQKLVLGKLSSEETCKTLESAKMFPLDSLTHPTGGTVMPHCTTFAASAITSNSVSCAHSTNTGSGDGQKDVRENMSHMDVTQCDNWISQTSAKPTSALKLQMSHHTTHHSFLTSKTCLTQCNSTCNCKRVPEGSSVCEEGSNDVLFRGSKLKNFSRHFMKLLPGLSQPRKDKNSM